MNPQHVQLSNISGGMSGCSGPGGIANPGLDYMAAATQTSGVAQLICSLDWSTAVDELGSLSQHLSDTFDLSSLPLIESIEVEINGFPTAVGWSYEPELNAVVFDIDHVPSNDQTIDVQYTVLGDCSD